MKIFIMAELTLMMIDWYMPQLGLICVAIGMALSMYYVTHR